MPANRFFVYIDAEYRSKRAERCNYVVDTAAAIAGSFKGDTLGPYLKEL